jgi:hypothetical protein
VGLKNRPNEMYYLDPHRLIPRSEREKDVYVPQRYKYDLPSDKKMEEVNYIH